MYDTNGQRGGNANAPPPPDKYGALRELGKNVQGRLSAVVAKLQGKDTQIYTEMNSCPPKPLQVTEARGRGCGFAFWVETCGVFRCRCDASSQRFCRNYIYIYVR